MGGRGQGVRRRAGPRSGLDAPPDPAVSASAFATLVARLRADVEKDAPRPTGYVPATALWMVDGGEVVGFLDLRHRLTPYLLEQGGHIGCSVRPSARRRGYASTALAEALPTAAGIGIEAVLVMCDEDDVGSRTVIERGGGVLEDVRAGTRRYWIRTLGPTGRGRLAG